MQIKLDYFYVFIAYMALNLYLTNSLVITINQNNLMQNFLIAKDELTQIIEESGLKQSDNNQYTKLDFRDLMNYRVEKILMVCSLYDYHTIVEDGHLQEAIFNEYMELNLYYAPHITRAYSGEQALKMLDDENFDLIITTMRIGDMEIEEFSEKAKSYFSEIPLVLLAAQSRELQMLIDKGSLNFIDKLFIWSGDRKIFLAIIKHFEDKHNAPLDCLHHGVTAIILVEDSPLFYSSYLPLIYTEIMKQTQKLIEEGKNSSEKLLRQRARPKILHAETYEEAVEYLRKYRDSILGIITDMEFKRGFIKQEYAGIQLIKQVKQTNPDLPILLQSSNTEKRFLADENGVAFLDKNSRTLLMELGDFMKKNFGFGDFIFRMPDGSEVHRARNIRELRDRIKYIPNESLIYHTLHNHFSHWLKARTQFELAHHLRPIHDDQFEDVNQMRDYIVNEITKHLVEEQRGIISVFQRNNYDQDKMFQMIGEGSLGGKARGLAFVDSMLKNYIDPSYFPNIKISIPRTIVLGTDVFTKFMEMNDLYDIAFENFPDDMILREFLRAELPPTVLGDIREILKKANFPIAVRSSSLLEDAVYQPFAGVYATIMIPNSNSNMEIRFHNLVQAIKFVFASTYSKNAKNYIEATGNRIEEEKMAVILQEMVGRKCDHYFYPNFSGVAKSYNFYPFGKSVATDGVVNLALGLGKTIVDGGISMQYAPNYPGISPQFSSTKDFFTKSQTKYWAVDLNSDSIRKMPNEDQYLDELSIQIAEKHGMLDFIASTYSPENDMVYEGIHRKGPRIINFAPILKSKVIPFNQIIKLMVRMSEVAMNCPVEIEFAVNFPENKNDSIEFGFLQVRPMVTPEADTNINIDEIPNDDVFLKTEMALGNGAEFIDYILFVKQETFDASITRKVGEELSKMNKKMMQENKSYVLIGPGRWGSSDPWLGIPIVFSSINAARVIVETPMPHMVVDPSQGSHFFHNMTSFKISYLTVRRIDEDNFVDWDWLNQQPVEHDGDYLKLVKPENKIEAVVDGHTGKSILIK
jgi:CheY-like chemotaxis protein